MATETTNYRFTKPAETDYYDVNVQNRNWDMADQELKDLNDKKVAADNGDISETKVSAFTTNASQWPIPAAGESPKTLWGKTKKFFEDFKSWMTGVCLLGQLVSNNTTNNSNLPASAAAVYQEAQLRAQQIAQLNSDKAAISALTAKRIASGTILSNVLDLGDNIRKLFIEATYYPSDIPVQSREFFIEVIKQTGTGRILVVAWEYSGGSVYVRKIYNSQWSDEWKGVKFVSAS